MKEANEGRMASLPKIEESKSNELFKLKMVTEFNNLPLKQREQDWWRGSLTIGQLVREKAQLCIRKLCSSLRIPSIICPTASLRGGSRQLMGIPGL